MLGPDFAATLAAAQDGDPEAFAQIYRGVHPGLVRYLRVFAGDHADDIGSETWIHVMKKLRTFTGGEDAFRGWIFTIGRRTAIDLARARARRPEHAAPDAGSEAVTDDAATVALERMSTDAAIRLIATLPPDQAEIIALRVLAGFDAATVATMVGSTPGAVRVSAHRALRRLAAELGGQRPDGHVTVPPAETFPL